FQEPDGTEIGPPSWSPSGNAVAWATAEGIHTSSGCDAGQLVIPGGKDPDWGPADPGQAAPTPAPTPQPQPQPQAKPQLAKVTFAHGKVPVTMSCTCKPTVVIRKGKRVVGRATGSGRVVVKLRKHTRGKLKLTATAGGQTFTRTLKAR